MSKTRRTASRSIAFRVDGNSKIGTGHLARCRVLADACLGRGWKVVWITATRDAEKYAPRAKSVVIPAGLAAPAHARRIRGHLSDGDVVVLDGYHFGRDLERELRLGGLKVATMDDNAGRVFEAHLVFNGNVHARQLRYRGVRGTKFALGPRYFIFSDEVRKARRRRAAVPRVHRILVTMGGADPSNQTLKVLRAVEQARLGDVSVTAIAGAANRNFSRLRKFASRCPFPCRVIRSTKSIGAEMSRADLGIGSAGRIATEMAYLGLPGLRIVLADNQKGLIRVLHRCGAAINLGWHGRLSSGRIAARLKSLIRAVALRRKMSDKGRRMLDGKGTDRVLKLLASL